MNLPNLPNRLTAEQIVGRTTERQKVNSKRKLFARILATAKKIFGIR